MVSRGREEVDVYSWGRGDLGQLGTSAAVSSSGTPTLVAGLHDRGVVHMAGSLFHSVALTGEVLSDGCILPRCFTCRCSSGCGEALRIFAERMGAAGKYTQTLARCTRSGRTRVVSWGAGGAPRSATPFC